jgi:hypothetical protein
MTAQSTALEKRFDRAMMDVYVHAKSDCDYNATYFLQMLHRYGGLETARRLLLANEVSSGFTVLWECGRLDLSVEAQVLRPEFSPLFSEHERTIAKDRLAQYGYSAWTEEIE